MGLPLNLTESQVREACAWSFWKRVLARYRAAQGDAQAACLLVAWATARSLARSGLGSPATCVDDTVRLLGHTRVTVEVARA